MTFKTVFNLGVLHERLEEHIAKTTQDLRRVSTPLHQNRVRGWRSLGTILAKQARQQGFGDRQILHSAEEKLRHLSNDGAFDGFVEKIALLGVKSAWQSHQKAKSNFLVGIRQSSMVGGNAI